jgi:RNA polymerase sigma-70 factor, ECF subfamily
VKLFAALGCYTGVETEPDISEAATGFDPLAERLANGDPKAPRELVERHYVELYRYARALLREERAAEDAVQQAFERGFAALGRYPEDRVRRMALRAWLYRITLNVVRNLWRDQAREELVSEAPVPEVPGGSLGGRFGTASDPEGGADSAAWLDAFAALGGLPMRQRTAVALRYLQDMPYAEISEATGWPQGTCKTLVRRGIRRLRVLLDELNADGGS